MKLLAIDGNSIMNRAFYGIRMLSNSKGQFTNALTGFMKIYQKEIAEIKPDCAAVAFDLKTPTFRHKAVESYKANRKGMPDELASQMPFIKEILKNMGVKVVECEGFEADDILGTLSRIFSENGNECYILTGDRDSLQLINKNVKVRLAKNKGTVTCDEAYIMKEYGLEPQKLIEVKALMGDNSDNIKGVSGIGEKTAFKLVWEFGTLENLYEKLAASNVTNTVCTKLLNGKDDAFQSRWLGTIVKNAPISENCEDYKIGKIDKAPLARLLIELEMNKLKEKLVGKENFSEELTIESLICENNSKRSFEMSSREHDVIFNSMTSDKKVYFTFENEKVQGVLENEIFELTDKNEILKFFALHCPKYCFEGKSVYKYAMSNNSELADLKFCADLAGYLLSSQSSNYTVERLCVKYNINYPKELEDFADAAALCDLTEKLEKELYENGMTELFEQIEMPLCKVLASMENIGVGVEADGVKEFGEKLKIEIDNVSREIYECAGKEFNILSPKQLGTVLFEDLGLPAKKKTKTGYSTNAEILEELSDKHEIVPKILEYRTLSKLNSTYVDGLLKEIEADGRVRCIFKQTETRTGRISSAKPNMQNIPVRKELGKEMRKFFVAPNGRKLVDADYSQIELRVLASVCKDENMIKLFEDGADIHTATAASVFSIPQDYVTEEMRRSAKAVNFGIVYGIGAFSLSKDIGVSVSQAQEFIDNYNANFPNVEKYMNETVDGALKNGYVKTTFGRRRYIPELSSSNRNLRAFGKRAAMNAPIQGTAADIIKLAMIKVYEALEKEIPSAKLILQVHDELIIEADEKDAEKAAEILKREMENAVDFAVKMKVDASVGKSWYEAKK